MVTIGVDAHKRVHQAVALDSAGRLLGSWRGANTPEHWQRCCAGPRPGQPAPVGRRRRVELWARPRPLPRRPRRDRLRDYPRWTAKQRRRARKPGKSDHLDAHAVAKLVHEEAATLPPVTAEDETAVLDLLVTEREAALAEATRLRNQLHHLLLQVDPTYATALPSLRSAAGVTALRRLQHGADGVPRGSTASRRSIGWRSAWR